MEIRYTIKIKDKHNPPEFKKGMGKGVLSTQDCVYNTIITEDDANSYAFQSHVIEFSRELLEDWFEVVAEVIDIKKERREKLKNLKK